MQYSWVYYRFSLFLVIWTKNDNIDRFITQTNSNIASSLRSIKWAGGSPRDHFSHFVRRHWHSDDLSGLGWCYLALSFLLRGFISAFSSGSSVPTCPCPWICRTLRRHLSWNTSTAMSSPCSFYMFHTRTGLALAVFIQPQLCSS